MKNKIFNRLFGVQKNSLDLSNLEQEFAGWHREGTINTLNYYRDNQYENGYASIQAIANQFLMIRPYAIDAKGNELTKTNTVNVLAAPNNDMPGVRFREALAIMSLVHNKVYIKVWHTGKVVSESSIVGFTFLEGVHEICDGKTYTYQTPQGETLTDKEVIVLKNVNPYNLHEGYSVANAARRWANLDDYIAAYQTGFFENGAVPAGQFIISAPSAEEYRDIVRNMKRSHRGAAKSNNVIYDYAPIDPTTGKTSASAITWVPFNTTNKDLALADIFTQVNQKIDSAYGVPSSMRGVSEGSTYVNVRVDQMLFIDNCIRPFATKIWTQFTHELNQVIGKGNGGGLGYFITFDLETPHIAEEDLAEAQAQEVKVSSLTALLTSGFTVESAIAALELPDSFLELEVAVEEPTEDIPEVDDGEDTPDTPDQEILGVPSSNSIEAIDVNCQHCNRYLFKATGTTVIEDMPCPKCKATNNFKIINPLGNDVTHKFTYKETDPKDWKMVAQKNQLSEAQIALITDKLEKVIRNQMEDQINSADVTVKNTVGDQDEAKLELYTKEVISIITPIIQNEGTKQYLMARTIQGVTTDDLTDFQLDDTQMAKYKNYLQDILKGYSDDTAQAIRNSLESSIQQNLPVQEIKKNLQSIMNTDEYRVKRISQTEANRAGSAGQIYAMEKVQNDTGLKIAKIWQTRAGACPICQALNGTTVAIDNAFLDKGGSIEAEDGTTFTNDFGYMEETIAHPNCGCYCTFEVIKD